MSQTIEILHPECKPKGKIRAAVFDFDGTVSTLRCGWEKVMQPLMLEYMCGGKEPTDELIKEVEKYIDESTGIQTVYQMQWLAERAEELTGIKRDPWWYKEEYNRRLMLNVKDKKQAVAEGKTPAEDYIVAGSVEFLKALKDKGIALYLASGTDHCDVIREAEILGVKDLFTEIKGAPEHQATCSKEAVLNMLFTEKDFEGSELMVVGDGKVEIALGKKNGAFALGAATDEVNRQGVNPVKRERLINAGADAIIGDFRDIGVILELID